MSTAEFTGAMCGHAMREYKRVPWETRWCFKCRKRLPHEAVLMVAVDPMEDWYGPHWEVECAGCREDHVRFPGAEDGPTLDVVYR